MAALTIIISVPAMAGSFELSLDAATAGLGKFAAEEIRREAVAHGMTLGDDANASRIALSEKKAGAAAQSYSMRVQNANGRRTIMVREADAAGAMSGGLDIVEAIHFRACILSPRW